MTIDLLTPGVVTEEVVDRLKAAIGEEKVLTLPHERVVRAA